MDEVVQRELLGAEAEEAVVAALESASEQGLEGVAECLATAVEGRLDDGFVQPFVAAELLPIVACQSHHGALHLGRRIEGRGGDGEEVFHVVPGLNERREDACRAGGGSCSQSFGHLLLDHTRATHHAVALLEHFEEDLARYVVGVVADDRKVRRVACAEIHLQEILVQDAPLQGRIMRAEEADRCGIDLDYREVVAGGQQVARQHARPRPHLQHGPPAVVGQRVGYARRDGIIYEEMLAQRLFRSDRRHLVFVFIMNAAKVKRD